MSACTCGVDPSLTRLAERIAQLERVWSLLDDANARAAAQRVRADNAQARAERAEAVIRRIGCVCGERGACEVCEWRAAQR